MSTTGPPTNPPTVWLCSPQFVHPVAKAPKLPGVAMQHTDEPQGLQQPLQARYTETRVATGSKPRTRITPTATLVYGWCGSMHRLLLYNMHGCSPHNTPGDTCQKIHARRYKPTCDSWQRTARPSCRSVTGRSWQAPSPSLLPPPPPPPLPPPAAAAAAGGGAVAAAACLLCSLSLPGVALAAPLLLQPLALSLVTRGPSHPQK
jgi:hypothetical protein